MASSPTLKARIKGTTPSSLWRFGANCRVYLERMLIWIMLSREVHGVGQADRDVLRRSFVRALTDAWRRPEIWRNPTLLQDALVEVRQVGRFKVRGGSDDLFHVWPGREKAITRLIKSQLRTGDVFVDAGANIGFYTMLAARLVGPTGRVHAIEMVEGTAAILEHHIALNQLTNVTVIQKALSDVGGQTVEVSIPADLWGQASIVRRHAGASVKARITTTTLDAVLADEARLRLMKLDLEGAELLALSGARETLAKLETLVFELQQDPVGDAALVAMLGAAGLGVTPLDSSNAAARRNPAQPAAPGR
jgi:FkbM family methyltransferase